MTQERIKILCGGDLFGGQPLFEDASPAKGRGTALGGEEVLYQSSQKGELQLHYVLLASWMFPSFRSST